MSIDFVGDLKISKRLTMKTIAVERFMVVGKAEMKGRLGTVIYFKSGKTPSINYIVLQEYPINVYHIRPFP